MGHAVGGYEPGHRFPTAHPCCRRAGSGKSTLVGGATPSRHPALLVRSGGGPSACSQSRATRRCRADSLARPTRRSRASVPDISMDGDPNTGFLVGQSQQFPAGAGGVEYGEYASAHQLVVTAIAGRWHSPTISPDATWLHHPTLYTLGGTASINDVRMPRRGRARRYINGVDAKKGTVTSVPVVDCSGSRSHPARLRQHDGLRSAERRHLPAAHLTTNDAWRSRARAETCAGASGARAEQRMDATK